MQEKKRKQKKHKKKDNDGVFGHRCPIALEMGTIFVHLKEASNGHTQGSSCSLYPSVHRPPSRLISFYILSLAFPFHPWIHISSRKREKPHLFILVLPQPQLNYGFLFEIGNFGLLNYIDGGDSLLFINSSKHFNLYVWLIESQNSPVVLSRSPKKSYICLQAPI